MEERDSEGDLMSERFNRTADYGWTIVVHVRKSRPNDFEHQYIMCSIWALNFKTIQGSEDAIGSGMCPWLGRENLMNLDLFVPAGEISYDELEGNVSAM